MPAIAPTPLHQWQILAGRWKRDHPVRDPLTLGILERQGDIKARAAFHIAALASTGQEITALSGIACTVCGLPTASWCEGCYKRCGPSQAFSAVCNHCDKAKHVCPLCQGQGVSFQAGHLAYLQSQAPSGSDGAETAFSVTSWMGAEGQLFEEETDVQISFEDLARVTGRDVAEIMREFGAEGSHRGPRS